MKVSVNNHQFIIFFKINKWIIKTFFAYPVIQDKRNCNFSKVMGVIELFSFTGGVNFFDNITVRVVKSI